MKGFRPGHAPHSYRAHDRKPEIVIENPIVLLQLASSEKKEYEENISKIRSVWRQFPDEVFQKRKELEKTMLMLKEIRRTCNGMFYLWAIDAINRDFKILGDYVHNQENIPLQKKAVKDLNSTSEKYASLYNNFNDECVCENKKKEKPVDKKTLHYRIIDEESEKMFNELEKTPDDLWLEDGLDPEKNKMLVEKIKLVCFQRELTDSLKNCNCDDLSAGIYNLYASADDLFEYIHMSDKRSMEDKNRLKDEVLDFAEKMTSPLVNFDSICSCHRRAVSLKKPVSEGVKELPDDWKRRTVYRLGGE